MGKASPLLTGSHFVLIARKMPSDGCGHYFRIRKYEKKVLFFGFLGFFVFCFFYPEHFFLTYKPFSDYLLSLQLWVQ